MDERTKELVAIAASVSARCQPCFKHHIEAAKAMGVASEDIGKAVQLARIISGKGDENMATFADELLAEGERKGFTI